MDFRHTAARVSAYAADVIRTERNAEEGVASRLMIASGMLGTVVLCAGAIYALCKSQNIL